MHAVKRRLWQVELLEQEARQIIRAARRHFKPNGLAVVALFQPQAQGGAQVFYVVFIDFQVRVAGDAKLGKLPHFAPDKQIGQVRPDDAGERQEKLAAFFLVPAGHVDEPRQDAGHLDDGDFIFPAEGIAPAQAHDEIQRLVGHLRKRVRRIKPDRNQQRPHGTFKVRLDPALLHRIALAMRHDTNAVLRKSRQQFFVVQRVLARHHVTGQR